MFIAGKGRLEGLLSALYFIASFAIDTVGRAVMEYCSGCRKYVSTQQEKKQRRLLSGRSVQYVLQTLKDFIDNLQGTQERWDAVDGG